jgi:putative MFS transporter
MTYPHLHGPVPFVLVGFGLVTSIYVLVGVGFAIYIPELFPTDLRMRGNGFANTLGRIVAMLTPYAVVPVYMADGVGGVTGVISLLLAVMAVSIWIVGIGTRQKSLEELAGGPGHGAEPLLRRKLEPLL